jgi:hypothetical protein
MIEGVNWSEVVKVNHRIFARWWVFDFVDTLNLTELETCDD